MKRLFLVLAISGMLLLATGCHRQTARVAVPPPPETPAPAPSNLPEPEGDVASRKHSRPIYVETGMASWYAAPYQNRRSSNGEVYNMNALTAAHRTLPLNSIARITNVRTGRSAVVRITDRGPFITGRMLDLSLAAAKQVDVWRAGVAEVRLEVVQSPSPIDHGGRWCVQVGAFTDKAVAAHFKEKLQRRYPTANVLQFSGPTGDWIRVRVPEDDKHRAERMLREASAPQGAAFLVRLA
jgi:rare lipoprotein A